MVGFLAVVDAVSVASAWLLLLTDEEGNDEAVDAASFAEDDTDKVLGLDTRHLDHGAED